MQAQAEEITYRLATSADIETLAQLRWQMETERHPEQPVTPALKDAYFAAAREAISGEIERGAQIAFLAEAGGAVIGCAILIWWAALPTLTELERRRGYVSSVYTDPAWRRRGIARRLMQQLIARAREMNIQRLMLKASSMGRPLYVDLGFEPSAALDLNL